MLTSNKLRLGSGTGSQALQQQYNNMVQGRVQTTESTEYGLQILHMINGESDGNFGYLKTE